MRPPSAPSAAGPSTARGRILDRVRRSLEGRPPPPHPGRLDTARADDPAPAEAFEARFRASGGEVVRLGSLHEAVAWLAEFALEFESGAVSPRVAEALRPDLLAAPPERAALGVSMARGAAADTGSLLLDSGEGRALQFLPPVQLVWVREADVAATLAEALEGATRRGDAGSVLALHSGPSRSADIGGVLVTGVHGPGRVVAAVLAGGEAGA